MKHLAKVLCCGVLMFGPALAGAEAIGVLGSTERSSSPPRQESAPPEQKKASSSNAQATKAGPLYNRFWSQEQAAHLDPAELDWEAADCGCIQALSSFETYGLYPFWTKPDEGKVNFEMWSRIGYFALSPNGAGTIEPPAGWVDIRGNKKQAHAVPARYGTKVDLVVSNDKWAALDKEGLALPTSYVLFTLVDNIVGLVGEFGFDGVTIDFDFSGFDFRNRSGRDAEHNDANDEILRSYIQSYLFFIEKLSKTLKAQNKEYRLHVVLGYYTHLPRLFTKEQIDALQKSVDLFLFVPNLDDGKKTRLMKRYDDYFKAYEYGELSVIDKKLVFIFDTTAEDASEVVADINSNRFGGVGVWAPTQPVETMLAKKVAEVVQLQDDDYIDTLSRNVVPGPLCKVVCPNRGPIAMVMVALMLIYGGGYVLSFFVTVIRTCAKTYVLYLLAGGLVTLLLLWSLIACVPLWWDGLQTDVTLAVLLLLGGYFVKSTIDKRREADYP